ncbi:hypothetical protein GCM10020220_085860 [Nonomuraea rubra]
MVDHRDKERFAVGEVVEQAAFGDFGDGGDVGEAEPHPAFLQELSGGGDDRLAGAFAVAAVAA